MSPECVTEKHMTGKMCNRIVYRVSSVLDHRTIVMKREAVTGARIHEHYVFVTLQFGQILNPMYGVVRGCLPALA